MPSGEGMQPTADWWNVSIEDIRTANEERRNRWHNLVDHVPYRRSELERLKRIATANLPPGQFFIADFDTLVSGYGEQYVGGISSTRLRDGSPTSLRPKST
jgi:hypothetical protein